VLKPRGEEKKEGEEGRRLKLGERKRDLTKVLPEGERTEKGIPQGRQKGGRKTLKKVGGKKTIPVK